MLELAIQAIIGLTAGFIGGLLGVGGSIIIIPGLNYYFKHTAGYTGSDQHLIQAAAMICNFFISFPAVLAHRRAHAIMKPVVVRLMPAALVGIICADLSLSFPDFRAGERTFQLLAQVSGRAGRGAVPGRVILQTYNPNHFCLLAAKDQDFKTFYNEEIDFRKALNYPPFSRMIQLKITGRDKEKTGEHALAVGDLCHALQRKDKSFLQSVEVLGPIEAPIPRIAKQYRWQILLKGLSVKPLHQFVRRLLFENRSVLNNRYVKVVADVDPFFIM